MYIKKRQNFDINTKVVDKNNKPMIMYHGGSYTGGEFKGSGWFTKSKADAKYYANKVGGIVIAAYLIIKNPFYSGDIKHLNIKLTNDIIKSCKKRGLEIGVKNNIIQYIDANAAVLIAIDTGRDGVIDLHENEIIDAVIFSDDSIKILN